MNHGRPLARRLFACAFLALLACPRVEAQLPKFPSREATVILPTPTPSSESISALRDALVAEGEELRRQRAVAPDGLHASLDAQIAAIEQLDLIYAAQLAALRDLDGALNARAEFETALEQLGEIGLPESGPYTLPALDLLRDEIDAEMQRKATLRASVETAEASLAQARKLLDQQETLRREKRDRAKSSSDAIEQVTLVQEQRVAELASRVAAAFVELRTISLRRERALEEAHDSQIKLATERLERMAPQVTFDEDDLRQQLDALDQLEKDLAARLERATAALADAEDTWLKVKERLDLATARDPVLIEQVEARRREYAVANVEAIAVRDRLQRIPILRELWQRRFDIASGRMTPADEREWTRSVSAAIAQYEPESDLQVARLADLRKEALALNERITHENRSEPAARWLLVQSAALQQLSDRLEENVHHLSRVLLLHRRLAEDLRAYGATRPWRDHVADIASGASSVWSYELTSFDDESITVGKLLIALLLLTLGLRLARVTSRIVGERLLPRFGVPVSAANALQTIVYYLAIVVVVLLALRTVNIPLTAFTLLGGAVAVGVGFGSQNIINNFISGLILLAERPISVGDMVEIEGSLGTIERIGPRSTRVRTFDNTHVLIPNSFFLENRFVNWSLSDDVCRSKVVVGVAYGSPTRRVADLLIEATKGVEAIQNWPEPWVRFTDFADDALTFELMFFIKPLLQKWGAESDVRYRIYELFAENGIEIAYPQRDVHLSASAPIAVRMLPPEPTSGGVPS